MILSIESTAQRYHTDKPADEEVLDCGLIKFVSGNQCYVTPVGRRAPDDTMRIVFMMEWVQPPSEEDAHDVATMIAKMTGGAANKMAEFETSNPVEAAQTANLMLADGGTVQ